jgi:hypothetical protein
MPSGLSLLMHQTATITKCSQFFLYALQPENKPSSYGDFSFNINFLLSLHICLLQNPTHNFQFNTQDLQQCQVNLIKCHCFLHMRSTGRKGISLRTEESQTNLPGNDICQSFNISLTDDLVPQ